VKQALMRNAASKKTERSLVVY